MNKELLQSIIHEAWEYVPNITLIKRDVYLEDKGNYVMVGPRQAGKSYLLYQRMQSLIAEGMSVNNLVYINFDDERLRGMKTEELDMILQAYHSMKESQPMLFFDEIQNVDGWANFARRLITMGYRVYITGSNATMLSREIETVLGGRYLMANVFPFDFAEYLKAKDIPVDDSIYYGRSRDRVVMHYAEYFKWGGFPELLKYVEKRSWLNGLFNRIYFNDIVVRYRIKNENALKFVIHKLAESVRQPISINRISNMVKSTGVPCSPSTAMDFLRYLQESFMVFHLPNYASKFVEKETVKKYYLIDNGLLTLFVTDAAPALLENLCAITLYKRYGEALYYYNKNIEVDFYIPEESTAIQACYNLSDAETFEREVTGLCKLNTAFPLKKAFILTYDEEAEIEREGLHISILPLWKWMLTTC